MDIAEALRHHPSPWTVHPVPEYRAKLIEVYGNELSCVAIVDAHLDVVWYIPDDPPGIGKCLAKALLKIVEVLDEP
jgi:hypothetical protein